MSTLAEVRSKIEALTVESVLAHVAAHPPRDFTILTLGPEPLDGFSLEFHEAQLDNGLSYADRGGT